MPHLRSTCLTIQYNTVEKMKNITLEIIDSPIGMMCAKKYAKEIGKNYSWVLERCKDASFPTIEQEASNTTPVIDILELNARIKTKNLIITSPRSKKKNQSNTNEDN